MWETCFHSPPPYQKSLQRVNTQLASMLLVTLALSNQITFTPTFCPMLMSHLTWQRATFGGSEIHFERHFASTQPIRSPSSPCGEGGALCCVLRENITGLQKRQPGILEFSVRWLRLLPSQEDRELCLPCPSTHG